MALDIFERLAAPAAAVDEIILDHDVREKGRFKTISARGQEVRVFLERGKTLSIGECLQTECGQVIKVMGAEESVVTANCDDWQTFSKACYHLGNRHVKIQVGQCWLRIKPDYVLEEMLTRLGLSLAHEDAVFEPESGAYASRGHHGHPHH